MTNVFRSTWIVALILSATNMLAQQDPMYSMYTQDKVLINPGYTGSSNWMVGTLKYREQFVGFDGHPVTETFNFHMPIQKRHIGVGFKVISDKTAVLHDLNASVFYAYHLNFGGGKLSLGIEAGVFNRQTNYQKIVLSTPGDNSMPITSASATVPDVSAGIYYQKKQFYFGLSDSHLIRRDFNYHAGHESHSKLYNHTFLLVGNVFVLSERWTFEPSALVKYQKAAPVQLDVNASLCYRDRVSAGVQFRSGDAYVAMLKINVLENLRVAYAYDKTFSGLAKYTTGAHEIIISYGIKIPPPPAEKEVHPRYYF